MQSTFVPSSNTTTGGVALGAAGQNVELKKIVIGLPVNSGNIYVFTITNPGGTSNTNLAAKLTLGGTVSESTQKVFDFTDSAGHGIILPSGGNVMIDQTMNVTVCFDIADEAQVGV